jgi:predicted O-methyltransferase YrrM
MNFIRTLLLFVTAFCPFLLAAQSAEKESDLDQQVRTFLNDAKSDWHDLNIPMRDGQYLHDLIVKHHYTQALEIGTSTGHSAIWIAWALSKSGGKLITVEIDEARYRQALANFKKAGLEKYIDARLADAHTLVKELQGPFDFVFSDADKEWYTQYFVDVAPRMAVGGCFVAHNITMPHSGIEQLVRYLQGRKDFKTTIEKEKTSGISLSYKQAAIR